MLPKKKPDQPDDTKPLHPQRRENPKAKRPKANRGDVDMLLRICWDQGAWIVLGGNGHYKIYPPNLHRMIPIPATPSDHRTVRNKRSQLRRAGFDLKIKK